MTKPTRLDYCQYLLSTPINYTLTHFADHCEAFSHDQINRYLADNRLRPRYVWENVKPHLEQTPDGYLLFDDTVLDKRHAREIAIAKKQYSGNARGIIKRFTWLHAQMLFGSDEKPLSYERNTGYYHYEDECVQSVYEDGVIRILTQIIRLIQLDSSR